MTRSRSSSHPLPTLADLRRLHLGAATQRHRLRRLSDTVALLLISEAGLRRAEVRHLHWSHVDLFDRTMWIPAGIGPGRTVSISPGLAGLLGQLHALGSSPGWVFSNRAEPPPATALSVVLWRACAAAGLPSERGGPTLHIHTLRRAHAAGLGPQIAEPVYHALGL